ncbi:histamine H2 receptor-like [Oculina patagonica]
MDQTCGFNSNSTSNLLPVSILNAFLSVLTTLGNSLILLAIYKTPGLRTNSNYLIASLAVADFSVGLIMNPLYAVKAGMAIRDSSHPLAVVTAVITLQTLTATTYSLCGVSIDRYLAIVSVFRYEMYVTTERCLRLIALIWICSFLIPLPRVFVTDQFNALPTLWLVSYTIVFIIPLSAISFCYFRIYKTAKAQARRIACEHIVNRREAIKILKNRKATWTAAAVIGACFSLWLPSCILSFVQSLTSDDCLKIRIDYSTWFWVDTLAFASSAVNPWIYFLRSREFKQALKRIVRSGACWYCNCQSLGQRGDDVTGTEEIQTREKANDKEPQAAMRLQSFSSVSA